MDPIAIIGLVLAALGTGVAVSAEIRSRKTDERQQKTEERQRMMDTPQTQATYVDSHFARVGDRTRAEVRARIMNAGFVEDIIKSADLIVEGFPDSIGRGALQAFGRPTDDHDIGPDSHISAPDNALFDFVFEFDNPLALDSRKATLKVIFLRRREVRVDFQFGQGPLRIKAGEKEQERWPTGRRPGAG